MSRMTFFLIAGIRVERWPGSFPTWTIQWIKEKKKENEKNKRRVGANKRENVVGKNVGRREKNSEERKKREGKKKGDFSGISMVREEKSIHATEATCGYQNLGVSSNSTR